jgi:hypothetical protein
MKMPIAAPDLKDSSFLSKEQLINLKTRAMRSGAWFKALQRIDRVLIDLTIRVVENIRSALLAKSILMLTKKLEDAMASSISSRLKRIGFLLAQKISLAAQKLGNQFAKSWAYDSSFAAFLAVLHINEAKSAKRGSFC